MRPAVAVVVALAVVACAAPEQRGSISVDQAGVERRAEAACAISTHATGCAPDTDARDAGEATDASL